jgi:hypothetical protein
MRTNGRSRVPKPPTRMRAVYIVNSCFATERSGRISPFMLMCVCGVVVRARKLDQLEMLKA